MNVTSVTSHFPTANKGFITTLGSSILASAVTVPLTSVSGLTNGTVFVGIIEPGLANEQEFTGIVDTAGVQITGVKWTDGTDVDHTAGVTIVDYVSATGQNMQTKALIRDHDQTGYHKTLNDPSGNEWIKQVSTASAVNEFSVANAATGTGPVLSATGGDTNIDINVTPKGSGQLVVNGRYDGWSVGALPAVSSVTNNGNRSYDITFASTVASILSGGMRLRTTRTVAAPTYMGGLMNGSSHYFVKTTPTSTLSTITNNFSIKATVMPTSYADGAIAIRGDAAANNTLEFRMTSTGQLRVQVSSGGSANYRYIDCYQSLPLNKKSKLWVSWTGGTVVMKIDGATVPTSAAVTGGTAPTTAGTGGDFAVGRRGASATMYFPGYISDVGIFDAVITPTTMLSLDSQALTGSETNCIGAWSLNNTAVNQQAAGTNDLTATGGVGYSTKSPYGNDGVSSTLDYALVMNVNAAVVTVQVPEGCTIPTSGGVTSVAYSVQGNPYGWVSDKGRWEVASLLRTDNASTSNAAYGSFISGGWSLTVPVGPWNVGWQAQLNSTSALTGYLHVSSTVLTGMTVSAGANVSPYTTAFVSATGGYSYRAYLVAPQSHSTAQTYVMYTNGATTGMGVIGTTSDCRIFATPNGL